MYERLKNVFKILINMGKQQKKRIYIKGYPGRGKEVLGFLASEGGRNDMHFTGEENGLLYIDEAQVIRLVTIYSDIDIYEEIVRTFKRVYLPSIEGGYAVVQKEDVYPTAELATYHMQYNARYKKGEYVVRKLEAQKK